MDFTLRKTNQFNSSQWLKLFLRTLTLNIPSRLTKLASVLVLLAFITSTPVLAQWREPFNTTPPAGQDPTTGSYLEVAFQRFLGGCNILPVRWTKADDRGRPTNRLISAVPIKLQQEILTLDIPVEAQWDRSLATVFAYIYRPNERTSTPSVEIERPSPPSFESDRILNLDLVADPSAMVPQGASSVRYVHTCGSMLNQAANANLGFKIPFATLESGLKAEYEGTTQTMIGVVEGTFTSPVQAMIDLGGRRKLFAQFLFWDWYDRTRPAAAEENYYLKRFDGLAGAYLNRTKTNFEGSLNIKGELAVAVAGAKTQTNAGLEQNVTLTATGYSTAAYKQGGDGGKRRDTSDYAPLPKLANLVTEINANAAPRLVIGERLLVRNGEHTHQQIIDGVPRGLCSKTSWAIKPDNTGLSLVDVSSTEDKPFGVDRCVYTIKYEPPDSIFETPRPVGAGVIKYSLETNRLAPMQNIRIESSNISFEISSSPDIQTHSSFNGTSQDNKITTGGVEVHQLRWPVQLIVRDNPQDSVDWGQNVEPSAMNLVCADDDNIPVDVTVTSSAQRIPNERLLLLTASRDINATNRDFGKPPVQCKLEGTLKFRMISPSGRPRSVQKSLPPEVKLFYPARVVTP